MSDIFERAGLSKTKEPQPRSESVFDRAGIPKTASIAPAPPVPVREVDRDGRPFIDIGRPFRRLGEAVVNPPGEGSFIERAGSGLARGLRGTAELPADLLAAIPPPGPGDSPEAHANYVARQRAAEKRMAERAASDPSPGDTDFYEAVGSEAPFAVGGFGAGALRARAIPVVRGVQRAVGRGIVEKSGEQFLRSKKKLAAEELTSALASATGQALTESPTGEVVTSTALSLLAPSFVPRSVGRSQVPSVEGFTPRQVRSAQDVVADASGDLDVAARTTGQTPQGGSVFASVGQPGVGDVGLRRVQDELAGREPVYAQDSANRRASGIARVHGDVQGVAGSGRLLDARRVLGKQQAAVDLVTDAEHTERIAAHRSAVRQAQQNAADALETGLVKNDSAAASGALQEALLRASDEVTAPIGAKFDAIAERADAAGVVLRTEPLVASLETVAASSDWNKVLEVLPPTMRNKVESTIRFKKGAPVLDESGAFPRWSRPSKPDPISWTELRALQQRVGLVRRGTKDAAILHDIGTIEQGIKDSFDTAGGTWRTELDGVRKEYAEAMGVFRTGQMEDVLQPNARKRDAAEDVVGQVWRSDRQNGALTEATRLRSAVNRKPELMESVERAVLAQAYDASAHKVTGVVQADALQRWKNSHQRALGQFPEIAEKLEHPLKAQRAFETLRDAGEPNKIAAERTALSAFVKEPESEIARIVRQKDGAALSDLVRRTRDDPDAFAGLRRVLFDQSVGETTDVLTSQQLRSAIAGNGPLLRQAFGDEHVRNLSAKADEMERFEAITRRGPDVALGTSREIGVLHKMVRPFMERLGSMRWRARRETEILNELSADFTDSRVRQLLVQMDTDPELSKLLMSTATPANQRALVRYLTTTGILTSTTQTAQAATQRPASTTQEQRP